MVHSLVSAFGCYRSSQRWLARALLLALVLAIAIGLASLAAQYRPYILCNFGCSIDDKYHIVWPVPDDGDSVGMDWRLWYYQFALLGWIIIAAVSLLAVPGTRKQIASRVQVAWLGVAVLVLGLCVSRIPPLGPWGIVGALLQLYGTRWTLLCVPVLILLGVASRWLSAEGPAGAGSRTNERPQQQVSLLRASSRPPTVGRRTLLRPVLPDAQPPDPTLLRASRGVGAHSPGSRPRRDWTGILGHSVATAPLVALAFTKVWSSQCRFDDQFGSIVGPMWAIGGDYAVIVASKLCMAAGLVALFGGMAASRWIVAVEGVWAIAAGWILWFWVCLFLW
jgi:hypothetical protein